MDYFHHFLFEGTPYLMLSNNQLTCPPSHPITSPTAHLLTFSPAHLHTWPRLRVWVYWVEPALYGGETFAMSFTTMRKVGSWLMLADVADFGLLGMV